MGIPRVYGEFSVPELGNRFATLKLLIVWIINVPGARQQGKRGMTDVALYVFILKINRGDVVQEVLHRRRNRARLADQSIFSSGLGHRRIGELVLKRPGRHGRKDRWRYWHPFGPGTSSRP